MEKAQADGAGVLPDWHFEEANCIRGGWIGIEANRPVLHPMK